MTQIDSHEQFMRLFLRHEPRIYAFLRAAVLNDGDAEDLLQDVAAVLWRKFDEFEPGTQFDRWAIVTAKRQVQGFRRKRGRDRQRLAFGDDVLDRITDAMERAEAPDERTYLSALDHCVNRLRDDDRDLIRRRYQEGETGRSIAERLGTSESTVSRTLNRVYGQLLRCIERTVERGAAG